MKRKCGQKGEEDEDVVMTARIEEVKKDLMRTLMNQASDYGDDECENDAEKKKEAIPMKSQSNVKMSRKTLEENAHACGNWHRSVFVGLV